MGDFGRLWATLGDSRLGLRARGADPVYELAVAWLGKDVRVAAVTAPKRRPPTKKKPPARRRP